MQGHCASTLFAAIFDDRGSLPPICILHLSRRLTRHVLASLSIPPQIREMHGELIKHSMREDGEDNIYDTAGMAICLGVVQNYTFEHASAKSPWKLIRKEQTDEDALYGGFSGADGADSAGMIEGLMLTKKACMDFAEELQLEISEVPFSCPCSTNFPTSTRVIRVLVTCDGSCVVRVFGGGLL